QAVTAEAVHRAADLYGDDRADGRKLEQVLSRTILSSRGRTIRPKTVGQKTYTEAIESSTITFGIGPAGTGKTYLAVAMAVQQLLSKQINGSSSPGPRSRRGSGSASCPAGSTRRSTRTCGPCTTRCTTCWTPSRSRA